MKPEPIFFPARDQLKIEGLLQWPSAVTNGVGRWPGVALAHTHPQQPGGHMHARVLRAVAERLSQQGFAALRFNFRGAQNSEGFFDNGQTELHDVGGAVDYLRAQPQVNPAQVMLLGYSFGARVCIPYATSDERILAVATIGFPARHFVNKRCA